jgi:iron uptake system EfeUOB component EfeO/EfeM
LEEKEKEKQEEEEKQREEHERLRQEAIQVVENKENIATKTQQHYNKILNNKHYNKHHHLLEVSSMEDVVIPKLGYKGKEHVLEKLHTSGSLENILYMGD